MGLTQEVCKHELFPGKHWVGLPYPGPILTAACTSLSLSPPPPSAPALAPTAITDNAELFAGKRVLDVGTGSGILALWAAKAGATKVG